MNPVKRSSNKRTKHSMYAPSPPTFLLFFLLAMLALSFSSLGFGCAEAKEIAATNEWQLVEEGDSIPQGLHIRMNMETGEKWAKLLEEEEEVDENNYKGVLVTTPTEKKETAGSGAGAGNKDEEPNAGARLEQAVKITQLANAELTADASAKVTSQLLEQAQRQSNMMESIAALNDFQSDTTVNELDYEMMYRTLLSLPEDAHEYMGGGLPTMPAEDASEEEKKIFEARVKHIWKIRQTLLKQMEDEYLADVTDIVAERIESIAEYVANPMKQIRNVIALRRSAAAQEDGEDEKNKESDVSTIVGALEDLEFQLTDVDLARDFHTMGGWPLLVSLLTDSIHGLQYELQQVLLNETQALNVELLNSTESDPQPISIELSAESRQFLEEYQQIVWEIQGLACWSIGTAVKNMEEFHSWALDDFSDLVMSQPSDGGDSDAVTVITILLGKMDSESTHAPSILDMSPLDEKLQLRRKYEMYALGALLRGNRKAIRDFAVAEGPATLYRMFSYLTSDVDNMHTLDSTTIKLLTKIISLTDDLVMHIALHPTECSCERAKSAEEKLMTSLASTEWCMAPMQIMKYPSPSVQRKMLETMVNLSPHCSYDMNAKSLIQEIENTLSPASGGDLDEDLDLLVSKLGIALS